MTSLEHSRILAQVLWARLYASLRIQGIAGLVLAVAGVGLTWSAQALDERTTLLNTAARRAPSQPAGMGDLAPEPLRQDTPPLPSSSDTPELLKKIQQIALKQGLAWPAANYRYFPVSDDTMACFEVQTALKGPYPKLKAFISNLLKEEPALALREFTLSRTNSDAVDVEAKIRFAVFFQDGLTTGPSGSGGSQ